MSDDPRDIAPLTPLQDALDKLGSHGDGLELKVFKDSQGHEGAALEASKYVGKGWSFGTVVSLAKDYGYALMAKVSWRPKA